MAKRGLVVAALCALAAGCLPNRDNPRDPVNRVSAALVVADWPRPIGSDGLLGECEDAEPLDPGVNPVSVAPIGHCLVLDARESDAPSGKELGYEFFGGTLSAPVSAAQGYLVLDEATRLSLVVGTSHTFSVRVSTSEQSESAHASVFVTNSAPAVEADRGVTLPAGGYPWRPGEDFTVTLSATGSDPENDVIEYCWRSTTGDLLGCSEQIPSLDVTMSPAPQQLVSLVVASDGNLSSLPSAEIVRVAPPTIWTGTSWVDPTIRSLRFGALMSSRSVTVSEGLLFSFSGNDPGLLETWDAETFAPIGSLGNMGLLGGPAHLLVPRFDPSTRRLWALGADFVNGGPGGANVSLRYFTWIVDATGTVFTPDGASNGIGSDSLTQAEISHGFQPVAYAVLSSNGDAWMSLGLKTEVFGIDPATDAVFTDGNGPGVSGFVTGLAARPGHAEVWSVRENPSKLVLYDREGIPSTHPVTATRMVGLAFADADRAWTWIPERGFVLFDASRLATSGFDASVILEEQTDPGLFDWSDGASFIAEPLTGTCYATSPSDGAIWSVDPEGRMQRFGFGGFAATVVATKPDGSVYLTDGLDAVVRGRVASSNAVYVTSLAANSASIDWARGGLWISQNISPMGGAFLHVDEGGGVLASFSASIDETGAEVALPYLDVVGSVSPDGRVFWSYDTETLGIGYQKLHSYALVTGSSGETAVMSRNHAPLFSLQAGYFVSAFAPVNDTANRLAWAGSNVSNSLRIYDTRQAAPRESLTLAISPAFAPARSLFSNDLCLLTDEAAPQLAFVRVTPAMSVTPISTFTPSTGSPEAILSAASDAEHDACWLARQNGATKTLEAYDRAGAMIHSTTIPSGVTDLRALGAHEILLDESGTVTRLVFTPGVMGSATSSAIATGASSRFTR